MIELCERCFAPVGDDADVVRLAHIGEAHADGSITWTYTFVHTSGCAEPRVPEHQRPDTGDWDPSRSVGRRS